MITEALPTSPTAGGLYLVLLLLGLLGAVLLEARIWPLTRCLRCRGKGKFRSPASRSWRKCPRCGGTGERRRTFSGKGQGRG